jgi:hypothetical protein
MASRGKKAPNSFATKISSTSPSSSSSADDVDQLIRQSQQQINIHQWHRQNEKALRRQPDVMRTINRVASAMGALRLQKATRCYNYWDPQREGKNKKQARTALLVEIERFVAQPETRRLRQDIRYYDTINGAHPDQPTMLVFNVLSDQDVNTLISEYSDCMTYRKKTDTYVVPRYLRLLSRSRNLGVSAEHWHHVAQSVYDNQWTADDFYHCLEKARQRSNRYANDHYRKHPEETRSHMQLVRDNVLEPVMSIAWQFLLERVFDSVHNGCCEVNHYWDVVGHLPGKVRHQDTIDCSRTQHDLRNTTYIFLQWSYHHKRQIRQFQEANPSAEYKSIREEGKRLVNDMLSNQVPSLEIEDMPWALNTNVVFPVVRLRLKQRRRPLIRRPDVQKRVFPKLARRLGQEFEKRYEQHLYRSLQEECRQQRPQKDVQNNNNNHNKNNNNHAIGSGGIASARGSNNDMVDPMRKYREDMQLARQETPEYVPEARFRALSLCHAPYVKKNIMHSIVREEMMLSTFHETMLQQGQEELRHTSPQLVEHEQIRRQTYLSIEVYAPPSLTFRQDNQNERVVYQFNQT